METEQVLNLIHKERVRQETLKVEGRFKYTAADNIPDQDKFLMLAEEYGEVSRAILGRMMIVQDGGDLRKELIQVAAIATAWIESLGKHG